MAQNANTTKSNITPLNDQDRLSSCRYEGEGVDAAYKKWLLAQAKFLNADNVDDLDAARVEEDDAVWEMIRVRSNLSRHMENKVEVLQSYLNTGERCTDGRELALAASIRNDFAGVKLDHAKVGAS